MDIVFVCSRVDRITIAIVVDVAACGSCIIDGVETRT